MKALALLFLTHDTPRPWPTSRQSINTVQTCKVQECDLDSESNPCVTRSFQPEFVWLGVELPSYNDRPWLA